jgi:predicted RNA-binding protein
MILLTPITYNNCNNRSSKILEINSTLNNHLFLIKTKAPAILSIKVLIKEVSHKISHIWVKVKVSMASLGQW